MSRGSCVHLQFALSKNKTELEKAIVTSKSLRTRGNFPDSNNPVDTAQYTFHKCHMKNAFRTFPPVVPALCDWLVVPKVRLLAFGRFYHFVSLVLLPLFSQNVPFVSDQLHLSRTNLRSHHIWCSLIWEQPCFCLSLSTNISRRAALLSSAHWWITVIHYMLPKNKSWINQSACLFSLIIREEMRKKNRTLRQN